MLFVIAALAGCGQLFGFDSPQVRPDSFHQTCSATGLQCNATPVAMNCNTCWATCADGVSQADARMRCSQWGGSLVVLTDSDFTSCLRTVISGDVWIDLSQSPTAPTVAAGWTWGNGATPLTTNWATNEPDDDNAGTEAHHADAARALGSGLTWDDVPASTLLQFACTRDNGN